MSSRFSRVGKNGARRARERKDNIAIATDLRALPYLPHTSILFRAEVRKREEERDRGKG